MYKHIQILVVLLLFCSVSRAQLSKKANLSVGFEVGEPLGEFDDNYNGNPAGIGINLALPRGKLPIQWGLDFGYASMGSKNHAVDIQDEDLDIIEGNMKIKSHIYSYHATARFKPFDGFFAPYIEGLAGLRTFNTNTKIEVDGLDDPYSTEKNSQGVTFSYGWAAGLMFNVGKLIYLEGRFEKLHGSDVKYVDQNSVQVDDNGNFTYDIKKSNSNIANIQLGIGFRF